MHTGRRQRARRPRGDGTRGPRSSSASAAPCCSSTSIAPGLNSTAALQLGKAASATGSLLALILVTVAIGCVGAFVVGSGDPASASGVLPATSSALMMNNSVCEKELEWDRAKNCFLARSSHFEQGRSQGQVQQPRPLSVSSGSASRRPTSQLQGLESAHLTLSMTATAPSTTTQGTMSDSACGALLSLAGTVK